VESETVWRVKKNKLEQKVYTADDLMNISMAVDQVAYYIRVPLEVDLAEAGTFMSRKMRATLSKHPVAKDLWPRTEPSDWGLGEALLLDSIEVGIGRVCEPTAHFIGRDFMNFTLTPGNGPFSEVKINIASSHRNGKIDRQYRRSRHLTARNFCRRSARLRHTSGTQNPSRRASFFAFLNTFH
jgi:hypothetical protein